MTEQFREPITRSPNHEEVGRGRQCRLEENGEPSGPRRGKEGGGGEGDKDGVGPKTAQRKEGRF